MADSAAGLQILVTSVGSNAVQVAEIRKLLDLFENKQVTFECVDGSMQAELRNKLWGKSGRRTYPQVFLHGEYWGDLDKIQLLVDNDEFDAKFAAYMAANRRPQGQHEHR